MFIDETTIHVTAGDGGNGSSAMRREKYVPLGGPAGGNGGKGSDIIFKVDEGLRTLVDLHMKKNIKGNRGANGSGKNQYGANAEDVIINVPPGTIVTNTKNNEVIADLTINGEEAIIAKGGRGGRGNKAFATGKNPAPSLSENGAPGEELIVKVELKLLADVGLVGMPSVGKSTIISVISSAKPKIADYHFTTLNPNLGVVKIAGDSFVVADLPGLIEGASHGEGLGDKFLKHIQRTKVIVHVIDMASVEGRDPFEDYKIINKELEDFDPSLLKRPQVIFANKMDLDGAKENLLEFKKKVSNIDIFEVSAAKNDGFDKALLKVLELVNSYKEEAPVETDYVEYEFKEEKGYEIVKVRDDYYEVVGDMIDRLFIMTNFSTDEGMRYFLNKMKNIGVYAELDKMGLEVGTTVKIKDIEFDYKK